MRMYGDMSPWPWPVQAYMFACIAYYTTDRYICAHNAELVMRHIGLYTTERLTNGIQKFNSFYPTTTTLMVTLLLLSFYVLNNN